TLAILPSLMVDIDNDVFAMPLESVVEIVSVRPQDMMTVYGQWTARVRGRVVSLVRLGDVLSFNDGSATEALGSAEETTLVIVGESGRELGLAVSRVLGEEDIVIKSMAENYRNVPGIAGASILGDGRVSLILDLAALIDMCAGSKAATVA
ncbi:MAG: chemotaxis protein CheW, partial [Patescibacteria group bacterium]|nr:chemotaxis protein CheW [Patescibacteria group bacterium]